MAAGNNAFGLFNYFMILNLAINRWDILGGLNLLPSVNRSYFFKVFYFCFSRRKTFQIVTAIGIVLAVIIGVFVSIPGYGYVAVYVPPFYGGPVVTTYIEANYNSLSDIIDLSMEAFLCITIFLYVWITLRIIYQVRSRNWSIYTNFSVPS